VKAYHVKAYHSESLSQCA